MSWAYDALGRVTGKAQVVGSVTKSVGYGYTNGDLTTLVTPSGQTITYGYTNHQITSVKVGSTTLLSGVTYDPFGPATGWTWGNSTASTRSFDLDGNPSRRASVMYVIIEQPLHRVQLARQTQRLRRAPYHLDLGVVHFIKPGIGGFDT